jgi:hypothetical protein
LSSLIKSERGAAMVEFAIICPLLVICLAVIVNTGLLHSAKHDVMNAARCGSWMHARNPQEYTVAKVRGQIRQHYGENYTVERSYGSLASMFDNLAGKYGFHDEFEHLSSFMTVLIDKNDFVNTINETKGVKVTKNVDLIYYPEPGQVTATHRLSSNSWSFEGVLKSLLGRVASVFSGD